MQNNTQYPYPKTVSSSSQQGAVLIVVLLFLVLIILAGIIAVERSTTDLRLATSDQINTLLLQSADNANESIEQSINGDSRANIYTDMVSRSGAFGHFILDSNSNREHEYVFCFRPRGQFFDINKTTVKLSGTDGLSSSNVWGNNDGYCNLSEPADYTSERNVSLTQVNIIMTPPNAKNEAFDSYTIGQDSSEIASQAYMFDINSTAILPAYSGSASAIENCLKKTSKFDSVPNKDDTIAGCMAKASVPNTALYEKASVENLSQRTKCTDFGVGDGLVCTLPVNQ